MPETCARLAMTRVPDNNVAQPAIQPIHGPMLRVTQAKVVPQSASTRLSRSNATAMHSIGRNATSCTAGTAVLAGPRRRARGERGFAHGFADGNAVLAEVPVAAGGLRLQVLGMIAPGGERFLGFELDDRHALPVVRRVLAIRDEPRHRSGELVHTRTRLLDLLLDARPEP